MDSRNPDNNNPLRIHLDASFQGVKRFLFLLLTIMLIKKLKETALKNIFFQE